MTYFAHETACIDHPCDIGADTKVWHYSHIMAGARIGPACILGQNVYVAGTVEIGRRVRIQNNVSIYDGVRLDDFVFCGPSCVFTNVLLPRAEISRRHAFVQTHVKRGASIGANATIVCGSDIGRYAFVGAGAVVRGHVPDYALVVGVPARFVGWVSRHGARLRRSTPREDYICDVTGWRYREDGDRILRCIDWPEDRELEFTV